MGRAVIIIIACAPCCGGGSGTLTVVLGAFWGRVQHAVVCED
jgi:hypothetical protein